MTHPTPQPPADDALLSVRDLQVHYPIRSGILQRRVGAVKAVDGVSFDVVRGTTYGLVGESGCGKSTLGRAVLRLEEPTAGTVHLDGRDVLALGAEELRRERKRMQMVFQDPLASLDPRQTVESALTEPLAVHGAPGGPSAWRTRVRGLLDRVGLPAGAGAKYPHEFSGGQRQRVGIARALVLDPALLVADEPVSALDVSVQAQVLVLLEELQRDLGLTYLVIAHDLAVVKHVSTTVGVMYLGGLVEEGPSGELYDRPLHPYTRALLSAAPVPDPVAEARRERIRLVGDLPSPADPPTGCRFRTRCPWVQETRCHDERPQLRVLDGHPPQHRVACHFAEEIEAGRLLPHRGADPVPVGPR
ncbi:oligopeptide/dipeptide ABC transporter ATP-binding protein [Kineococcus endophyticus]|uniref:Oligopeptide/dipeptide ABC transporter ATP-binding protein n=1 Tax=Kineococcus endophyticus TaxID=1181883 RepID=A0ABV3PAN2_9ACTN